MICPAPGHNQTVEHRARTTTLAAATAAAGFVVAGIATLAAAAIAEATVPWTATIVFTLTAVVTVAAVGVLTWSLTADRPVIHPDPDPVPPAPAHDAQPDAAAAADAAELALQAQRQLLDDVRHELKTPITIVRGHLELLDPADADDCAATRDLGLAELDRMTRLIGDIDVLAAVEGDGLSPTDVSLPTLTARLAELVTVIPGHTWSVEQTASAVIRGDEDRLLQAWLALADNAAKYTPDATAIEIGSAVGPAAAQLWVRDHGTGIPPALRHRVFRRFDRGERRRSAGGSGLGLAIVDAIARAHGGRCTIADTPGGGATFTIELPLGAAATIPAPVRAGDVLLQREVTG